MIEDFIQPQLYRIDDTKAVTGCFDITGSIDEIYLEANRWNSEGFGIYWAVNEFNGPRKIANLKNLRAWFVECDDGDKRESLKKLRSKLIPSLVIESKRGFHAYWLCRDATLENYRDIIESRLIPFYGGDPNAKDVSRILRVPGFFHCKDPKDKFMIRVVHENWGLIYPEEAMLEIYQIPKSQLKQNEIKSEVKKSLKGTLSDSTFENIYRLDCRQALTTISGSDAVCGERFEFRKVGNGLNIYIDGKSTSCWVDAHGRIGSLDRGGPTIWQWINWYHRDHKKTYRYVKQFFPEVFGD